MPIHPTAIIHPGAELDSSVEVGPCAVIDEHVKIGPGCRIWAHAHVTGHTTMGESNQVHMGAVVGHWPQHLAYDPAKVSRLSVGANNVFREYSVIHGSFADGECTVIGDECLFMNQSHVAHDCHLGSRVIIATCSMLAGHVTLGDSVFISGLSGAHQNVRVGRLAMISGLTRITQDVPPFMTLLGESEVIGLNTVGIRRAGINPDTRLKIKRAYKNIYFEGRTTPQAAAHLQETADCPEVEELAEFLATTQRGISGHRRSKRDEATNG